MKDKEIYKDENIRIKEFVELDKKSIPADGGPRFNRLIFANSPVFLSIGYATCHWCHVMAHESFADPEVAEVPNRHLVAVKVDREERPDIDAQYMMAVFSIPGAMPKKFT